MGAGKIVGHLPIYVLYTQTHTRRKGKNGSYIKDSMLKDPVSVNHLSSPPHLYLSDYIL